MRRCDVKPGVVYAYRRPVSNEIVPVVFLSYQTRVSTLRQDARGYGDRAFKRPRPGRKPQPGTVHNDGTIGFPAVIFAADQMQSDGKVMSLRDFDNAASAGGDGYEFVLVTSMARITGEW